MSILSRFLGLGMMPVVEDAKYNHIHVFPEGLVGKEIVSSFIEKRRARKSASHSSRDKNSIIKANQKLIGLIKEHKITEVKALSDEIVMLAANGLQETYFAMFEELLLLKKKLETTEGIIQRHGSELSKNDFEQLLTYAKEIQDEMQHKFNVYLNDLNAELKGKEVSVLSQLAKDTTSYNVRSFFSIFSNFFEWFTERGVAKAPFKDESRLERLEHTKVFTVHDAREFLRTEKNYSSHFRKIMEDMSIFSHLIIKSAYNSASAIGKAASVGVWDLPTTMKVYETGILNLLNEEHRALESLNKCKNQLLTQIGKVISSIEKEEAKAEKRLKELKAVTA